MAIAIVDSLAASSTDGNSVTSASMNTTGADGLVVVVGDYSAQTLGTVTDSKGNTFTALTSYAFGVADARCTIFYCADPTVGSGHTFTYTIVGGYPSIAAVALSGCDTAAFYDSGKVSGSSTDPGTTSLQPGSLTPSADGAILISGLCVRAAQAISVNAPFSPAIEDVDNVDSQCCGLTVAVDIQTTATARNPTWTTDGSTDQAATMAAFLSSGGGGGSSVKPAHYYAQMRG
jgi:hypothetical protein